MWRPQALCQQGIRIWKSQSAQAKIWSWTNRWSKSSSIWLWFELVWLDVLFWWLLFGHTTFLGEKQTRNNGSIEIQNETIDDPTLFHPIRFWFWPALHIQMFLLIYIFYLLWDVIYWHKTIFTMVCFFCRWTVQI